MTGLFFIYYTRLKGNNEKNLEMGLYLGFMVFGFGFACFRTCVRPLWMEFLSSYLKLELPFKMKLHPSMLAQVRNDMRSLDVNLIIF